LQAHAHVFLVAQSKDEQRLFRHSPAARKLNEQAKKLARADARAQWWAANKPQPKTRNGKES
jgi:hypothetical protein